MEIVLLIFHKGDHLMEYVSNVYQEQDNIKQKSICLIDFCLRNFCFIDI